MALTINMNRDGDNLTVSLEGRLDTMTAPKLEADLRPILKDGITSLTINLKGLDYVSSAGLRVLLASEKIMNKQGKMTVCNVNDAVMDVFEVTGFVNLLNIE